MVSPLGMNTIGVDILLAGGQDWFVRGLVRIVRELDLPLQRVLCLLCVIWVHG